MPFTIACDARPLADLSRRSAQREGGRHPPCETARHGREKHNCARNSSPRPAGPFIRASAGLVYQRVRGPAAGPQRPATSRPDVFDEQLRTMTVDTHVAFTQTFDRIRDYLNTTDPSASRGVAIFASTTGDFFE